MNRLVPYLLLALFGACWGATIPLTKIAVSTGHHPFGLIVWQLAIGALLLAPIVWLRGSRLTFDRRHLTFFAIVALVGTLLPNSFSYLTAYHLPGGVLSLVIALVPIFSFATAIALRLESVSLQRVAGVVLGATAIALIVLPDSSLPDPSKVLWVLVGLIAPFCYGIEANYLAVKQPADTGPVATLFGACVIGFLLILPVSIVTGTNIDPRAGIGRPELAMIASSALHVAAYVGYVALVQRAGPVFSSQIAYIVTPAGVLLSVVLLGEQPSVYLWLALLVLLAGLALVQPRQSDVGTQIAQP